MSLAPDLPQVTQARTTAVWAIEHEQEKNIIEDFWVPVTQEYIRSHPPPDEVEHPKDRHLEDDPEGHKDDEPNRKPDAPEEEIKESVPVTEKEVPHERHLGTLTTHHSAPLVTHAEMADKHYYHNTDFVNSKKCK